MDQNMKETYVQLKNEMDAAYEVLRHNPTMDNASNYTKATQAFTTFCVESMAAMMNLTEPEDPHDDILSNFKTYETCSHKLCSCENKDECVHEPQGCGKKLLYKLDANRYIESSDFLEDFPGWCYNCLLEHCVNTKCADCDIKSEADCSFVEIKNLNTLTTEE